MTLRARIAAAAGLAVAAAVIVAAISLYVAVRSELRGEVDRSLRQRAGELTGPLSPQGRPGSLGEGPPGAGAPPARNGESGELPSNVRPAPLGGASGYVQFVSPNGSVHVPGGQGPPTSIPIGHRDRTIAWLGTGRTLTDRRIAGTHLRVLTVGTGARGAVLIARPLTEVDHEMSRVLLILLIVGVAGIGIAAALGALVARAALTPIARFTRRTESLTNSLDITQRLPEDGRDELARLAGSFNSTLDALERSVDAQRNLVADASHELRTPIASLRANIQVLAEAERLDPADQESLHSDIVSELDELTRLVGDVVELARGTEIEGALEDVRLDDVVEAAVQRTQRRSDLPFRVSLDPTVVVGQASRVERAVANLLDNARRWSPEGGWIEVDLHDGVLTVRDHGPGFQEDDLPHVFERFYRADRARKLPGSGLGLAIVRQAAEAHHGCVEADNAPDGGAIVRVSFGQSRGSPRDDRL